MPDQADTNAATGRRPAVAPVEHVLPSGVVVVERELTNEEAAMVGWDDAAKRRWFRTFVAPARRLQRHGYDGRLRAPRARGAGTAGAARPSAAGDSLPSVML
jgi:hypothetical protein